MTETPEERITYHLQQIKAISNLYDLNSSVDRLEVIGADGREYLRYFKEDEWLYYTLQDDGRTMKIFIEDCK